MSGNTTSSSWSLGNFAIIESPSDGAFLRKHPKMYPPGNGYISHLREKENHRLKSAHWMGDVRVSGGYLSNFWTLACPSGTKSSLINSWFTKKLKNLSNI